MKSNELEERLIDFAVQIKGLMNEIPRSKAGKHLSGQLLRSGTSPALNYGEAQSAESMKDFVHKLQLVLKELRESFVNLRILYKAKLFKNKSTLILALKENNELIAIMVRSIQTSQKNLRS